MAYRYDGKKLTIDLSKEISAGVAYEIEITYTAQPSAVIAGKQVSFALNKGLFFINPDGSDPAKPPQIWTQGQPQGSSCWFPTIDAPNQRCTQEVYITVDERFKTLSNGVLGYSKLNLDHTRTGLLAYGLTACSLSIYACCR